LQVTGELLWALSACRLVSSHAYLFIMIYLVKSKVFFRIIPWDAEDNERFIDDLIFTRKKILTDL